MTSKTREGGCLCGAVRFRAEGDLVAFPGHLERLVKAEIQILHTLTEEGVAADGSFAGSAGIEGALCHRHVARAIEARKRQLMS